MAQQQAAPRQWFIWLNDFHNEDITPHASEQAFMDAVAEEAMRCVWISHRIGRGIVNAPVRQRQGDGNFFTIGWVFQDMFIPAARDEQPADPVEVEVPDLSLVDEPEPQAA